jgi:hypothetical protein
VSKFSELLGGDGNATNLVSGIGVGLGSLFGGPAGGLAAAGVASTFAGGKKTVANPAPAAPAPFLVQRQPMPVETVKLAPVPADNTKLYMIAGGAAVVVLLAVMLATRK